MSLLGGAVVRPCGEAAFVLVWGDRIDPAAGRCVARAAAAFDRASPLGLVEVVPTFRSLLVVFDPDRTTPEALIAALPAHEDSAASGSAAAWRVPVCLDGEHAEDLFEAAGKLGLTPEGVREKFLAATYSVGMYGFAPGFAYLAGVDPALAIPRRATPRKPMPAGSVIIAGGMAALASAAMPTGWYVIGRTAATMFRPDEAPMVPFAVGDTIRFAAIPADAFAALPRCSGGVERIAA